MISCKDGKVRMEGTLLDGVADVCCVIEAIVADVAKEDDKMVLPVREVIDFAIRRGIEKAKKGE